MKQSKDIGFFGLFGPNIWKRTVCGTSVQMWQQLLGGNVAMYYIVYIFAMAGLVGLLQSLYCSALTNTATVWEHFSLFCNHSIRYFLDHDRYHASLHRSCGTQNTPSDRITLLHGLSLHHSWAHGFLWSPRRPDRWEHYPQMGDDQ